VGPLKKGRTGPVPFKKQEPLMRSRPGPRKSSRKTAPFLMREIWANSTFFGRNFFGNFPKMPAPRLPAEAIQLGRHFMGGERLLDWSLSVCPTCARPTCLMSLTRWDKESRCDEFENNWSRLAGSHSNLILQYARIETTALLIVCHAHAVATSRGSIAQRRSFKS
jgi:hypothetical protein